MLTLPEAVLAETEPVAMHVHGNTNTHTLLMSPFASKVHC